MNGVGGSVVGSCCQVCNVGRVLSLWCLLQRSRCAPPDSVSFRRPGRHKVRGGAGSHLRGRDHPRGGRAAVVHVRVRRGRQGERWRRILMRHPVVRDLLVWAASDWCVRPQDCVPTFHELVKLHFKGYLKPPFNTEGRKTAGMTEEVMSRFVFRFSFPQLSCHVICLSVLFSWLVLQTAFNGVKYSHFNVRLLLCSWSVSKQDIDYI